MLKSSLSIAAIAGICAGLLALTQQLTGDRIENNIHERELRQITELTGTPPPASSTWTGEVWNMCNDTVLVRADAAGYGGTVSLLVAMKQESQQHRLHGLRVASHQETPGLADFLGQPDGGWLGELRGRNESGIGSVDTVTGATITSRAVLAGVRTAFSRAAAATPIPEDCGS